ncbi:MAG: hypothetical protein ACRDSJ_06430, partial [Rubrobacteraceae bacterium]
LEESLRRVGRIVPTVEASFGCVVGPTGEDAQFVDDHGEYIPPDVMLACLIEKMKPNKAVLPVNLSSGYRDLVEAAGGTLEESRAGVGNVAIKSATSAADLGASGDGLYIFPDFLPAPDCFMVLARALNLFRDSPLSEARERFGDSFGGVVHEELECPWAVKGRVMRGLAERFGGDPDAILTDGVKLNVDGGWVLMLPDPDNPLFYVYAEGGDSEILMREYVDLVRSLIKE